MRVLFAWTGVTSYMADCWRQLARQPGVELKIVIEPHASGRGFDAARVLAGLDAKVVDTPARADAALADYAPDVFFAVGWHSRLVRRLVGRFRSVPKVCCLDMPWRPQLRCVVARLVLWRYVRRFEGAFVPGGRAARYARWLGFPRVWEGLFGIRVARFASAAAESASARRGFLYVGRDSPEKGLDVLRAAYARYRERGGTWPLDFVGGVGRFVQPDGLGEVYRRAACLVLASSFDPWPLVVLEAKAAGLKAVVSDRCGNADELGAVTFPSGDVEALAEAMLAVERGGGAWRTGAAAADYDVSPWVERTLAVCRALGRSHRVPESDGRVAGM